MLELSNNTRLSSNWPNPKLRAKTYIPAHASDDSSTLRAKMSPHPTLRGRIIQFPDGRQPLPWDYLRVVRRSGQSPRCQELGTYPVWQDLSKKSARVGWLLNISEG